MHHDRRFTRIRPTGRLSRSGTIVIDAKSPVTKRFSWGGVRGVSTRRERAQSTKSRDYRLAPHPAADTLAP